jgi:conjugal transfer pilus assembly protein TraU
MLLALKSRTILLIFLLIFGLCLQDVQAVCKNSILNPVTDINWQGIFPVRIGGVTIKGSNDPSDDPPESVGSPVCICGSGVGTKIGIRAGFVEPARLIETVKDPYCFTTLGTQLSNPSQGFLSGENMTRTSGDNVNINTFQQVHWYIFPVWQMLDLFLDVPCLGEKIGFDIAYMSEIDPTHNNGLLTSLLNPEALLFANPVSSLACVADSIAANAGYPLDPLFWCMGSWGGTYPLGGSVGVENYIEGNAAIAAKTIYKMGRTMLLWDPGIDYCGKVPTPIWKKSNYKMHLTKPVRDSQVLPIGRSSLIWGHLKNPPYAAGENSSDNFLWILFRKNLCCLSFW